MKCLILLAAYNGGKFIAKQLDSIVSQTHRDWRLIVRDDGSTDNTLEILRRYAQNDSRIEILLNKTDKHGAYMNFWSLIEYARGLSDYDYCFFSDHDDIWDSDKLEKMLGFAEKVQDEKSPLCVYSDMRTIDGDDKVGIKSMNSVMGIELTNKSCLFFAHGYIWGCAAMVNRRLLESLPMPDFNDGVINILSHDNYMGKFAAAAGRLEYFDSPCLSHRRYGSNTTGDYKHRLTPKDIILKGTVGLKKLAKTHARVYRQTLYAIERFGELPGLDEYKKIIESGGLKGALGMRRLGIKRRQASRTAGMYIVMILGLYKRYMDSF